MLSLLAVDLESQRRRQQRSQAGELSGGDGEVCSDGVHQFLTTVSAMGNVEDRPADVVPAGAGTGALYQRMRVCPTGERRWQSGLFFAARLATLERN